MLLSSKGMIQWRRQKRVKGTHNTTCILCDHTLFHQFTQHFFPHSFRRLCRTEWRTEQRKNGEKGKYCSFVHTGQKFVGTELEMLWGARWLRQGHCVHELLRLYLSQLKIQIALTNPWFYVETANKMFPCVKFQTQEIEILEGSAVFEVTTLL